MTRTCLDLFSGKGGFSSAFNESDNWDVVTVEIDGDFSPDIQADLYELRPSDLPDADVILASPPCKVFSRAAAWTDYWDDGTPNHEKTREHIALLYHTLGLIRALDPEFWYLENPEGSKARWYLGEPTGKVTYCQYGTTYRKATYLWGHHAPMTYRWCRNDANCHEGGSISAEEGDDRPLPNDVAERSKVPYELSNAIREAVEGHGQQATVDAFGGTDA